MKIIVLSIDGLQPAYLGAYGNEWLETPTMDRWAAGGVVFDQHFADVPDPEASRRSCWTGRHAALPAESKPDLLQRLGGSGVHVVRVAGSSRARSASKVKQPGAGQDALLWMEIDALLPPWKISEKSLAPYFAPESSDEDEAAPPLEPWLDRLPSLVDAADEATFERIQRTYAAAVSQLDSRLADLADDWAKHGWADAVWIITGPRGLPLGEHGSAGFPASLNEELVHLPLLMIWPDGRHAGRRIAALTQPMDLAATIAALFGLDWSNDDPVTTGHSVLSLIHSPHSRIREHAVSRHDRQFGVRSAEWYLVHDDSPDSSRLYVKPDDRWEVNDVHSQHIEVCAELEQVVREFAKRQVNPEAK